MLVRAFILFIFTAGAFAGVFLPATRVESHIPHDQVIDLDAAGSATIVAIRTQYFISRNSGLTWQRQTKGIACPWNIEHTHRSVAISPAFDEDGVAFVTCSDLIFLSRDGGVSFEAAAPAPRGHVVDLYVAPDFTFDGELLALLSDGTVIKSNDSGMSWIDVPDLSSVTALSWTGNQIIAGDKDGALHLSIDRAAVWQRFETPVAGSAVTGFAFPNADLSQGFFAGTAANGVVEVRLQGSALTAKVAGLGEEHVTSVAFSAEGEGALLFATTWDGKIFRSDNTSGGWTDVTGGVQTSIQAGPYGAPEVKFLKALSDNTLFIGSFSGLYRSQDAGERWFRMDTTIGYINAVTTSPAEDGHYEVAVSAYANGIMRSQDFGKTWAFDQSGLHIRRLSLEYAPGHHGEQRLFSGAYNRIGFASGDGSAWRYFDLRGLEALYDNEGTKKPVGAASIRLSPDYDRDGTIILGMFPQGVLRSTDFGQSFEIVMNEEGPSWSLVMSPAFSTDGTVFANAGGSVYQSNDSGETWARIWGLDIDRIDLAMSNAFPTDRTLFAAGYGGLYRSQDAGESWQEIAMPSDTPQIVGLAVSSTYASDGLIYVQVAGEDLLVGRDTGERFEWRRAATPQPGHEFSKLAGQDGYDLFAFSPFFAQDRTLYGGAGPVLLRSTDAGLTWEAMPKLPRRFEAEHGVMGFFHVPIQLAGPWKIQKPEGRIKTLRWRMGQAWRKVFGGLGQGYGNNSGIGALDASDAGATLTVDFVGEGVRVIGTKGPDHGLLDIYLNGALVDTVDLYAPEMAYQAELLSNRNLTLTNHRLTLKVRGEPGAGSNGTRVGIDAIDTFH